MADYPFTPVEITWKRPQIDRAILQRCTRRSNLKGLAHCLGVLAILGASGTLAYLLFERQLWFWMALALYVHGALFAFNPQTHELTHGTVFRTRWLNDLFKRVFGFVHWTGNAALYKMSHAYHHRYTLHRQSEGEEVHPRAELAETVLHSALKIVDIGDLLGTLYDQVTSLFVPFLRNPRRNVWQRYIYSQGNRGAQRDVFWTHVSQFAFHVLFSVFAILIGKWFLVVVVTLPAFYGGRWYHLWVHDTMHVGKLPETDDFRLCCRSIRVDPFTSFLFWHMEWHTEHHAFAAVPCYTLGTFHRLTREHWDPPQTLFEAWREMDIHSRKLLALPE